MRIMLLMKSVGIVTQDKHQLTVDSILNNFDKLRDVILTNSLDYYSRRKFIPLSTSQVAISFEETKLSSKEAFKSQLHPGLKSSECICHEERRRIPRSLSED